MMGYDHVRVLRDYISKAHESGSLIITTRLDSDDIIHKDFVKVIQTKVSNMNILGQPTIISCPKQYFYNVNTDVAVVRRDVPNTYISLVEDNVGNLHTVFKHKHRQMVKHYPVELAAEDTPMEVMLVHGFNIMTTIDGVKGSSITASIANIPWDDFNVSTKS